MQFLIHGPLYSVDLQAKSNPQHEGRLGLVCSVYSNPQRPQLEKIKNKNKIQHKKSIYRCADAIPFVFICPTLEMWGVKIMFKYPNS
jgi:hypothetical protein